MGCNWPPAIVILPVSFTRNPHGVGQTFARAHEALRPDPKPAPYGARAPPVTAAKRSHASLTTSPSNSLTSMSLVWSNTVASFTRCSPESAASVSFQVCQHLVPLKARLSQDLVCSVVVCRGSSRGVAVGPPTAFLRRGTSVPWVSLPGPTGVPQSPLCGKAPTLVVCLGVVTSCVPCARVRTSRSCAIM